MLYVFSHASPAAIRGTFRLLSCSIALLLLCACENEPRKNYVDFGPEPWDEPPAEGAGFELGYLKNGNHPSPTSQPIPRDSENKTAQKLYHQLEVSSWVFSPTESPSASRTLGTGPYQDQDGENEAVHLEYYYQSGGKVEPNSLDFDLPYCVISDITPELLTSVASAGSTVFLPSNIKLSPNELTLELKTSEFKLFVICHKIDTESADNSDQEDAADSLSTLMGKIMGNAVMINVPPSFASD